MPNPNFTAYFVAPPIAPQCMYIKCVYIYVYLVFRKERLGERPMQRASRDALCVISTQIASRDALGTSFKKSILFLFFWGRTTFFVEKTDFFRFFSVKSRANPTFSAKIAGKPRFSANFRNFCDFSEKKASRPLKERLGERPGGASHRKSVPGRSRNFRELIMFPRKRWDAPRDALYERQGMQLRLIIAANTIKIYLLILIFQ